MIALPFVVILTISIVSISIEASLLIPQSDPSRQEISAESSNRESPCELFSDCAGEPDSTVMDTSDDDSNRMSIESKTNPWSTGQRNRMPNVGLIQLPIYQPTEPKMDDLQYFSRSFFRWLARKRARHHWKQSFRSLDTFKRKFDKPTRNDKPQTKSGKSGSSSSGPSSSSRRNRDFQTQGW